MRKNLTIITTFMLIVAGLALTGTEARNPPATVPDGTIAILDASDDLLPDSISPGDGDATPEIRGIGNVAHVILRDSTAAGQPAVSARVVSTSDPGGETITLYADPFDNTLFEGTIGFETSVNIGNQRVAVAARNIVTAEYTSGGCLPCTSAAVEWLPGEEATVSADSGTYIGTIAIATITIREDDENHDTTVIDRIPANRINYTSEADPRVFSLRAVTPYINETGPNTNVFEFDLEFATGGTSVPATPAVGVSDGTIFTIIYADPAGDDGFPVEVSTTAAWQASLDGRVAVMNSDFDAIVVDAEGLGSGVTYVRLEDRDLAGAGSASVQVVSVADPVGFQLTMAETGSGTGEFLGSFGYTSSGTSVSARLLRVDPVGGDMITITYTDTFSTTGVTTAGCASCAVTIPWSGGVSGNIQFRQGGSNTASYNLDSSTVGSLRLTDADLVGSGTQQVRVSSVTDPIGVLVTLTETAPGSGVFTGTFVFETELGGAGSANEGGGAARLLVRARDSTNGVVATYVDALRANGARDVVVTDTVSLTNAPDDPAETTGTMRFKNAGFGSDATLLAGTTGSFRLEAVDPLWNTDDTAVDSFTAYVVAGALAEAVPTALGWPAWDTFAGGSGDFVANGGVPIIAVSMVETGDDTNVFRDTTALTALGLGAVPTQLRAVYSYASHPDNQVFVPAPLPGPPVTSDTPAVDRVGIGIVMDDVDWEPVSGSFVQVRDILRGDSDGIPATNLCSTQVFGHQTLYGFIGNTDEDEDTSLAINGAIMQARSTSDPIGISFPVQELYAQSMTVATRAIALPAWYGGDAIGYVDDAGLSGAFGLTAGASGGTSLHAEDGDVVAVEYLDPVGTGSQIASCAFTFFEGTTGSINIDAPTSPPFYRSGTTAVVTVTDDDRNQSPSGADLLTLDVTSDTDPAGTTLQLRETSVNTGVFDDSGGMGFQLSFVTAGPSPANTIHVTDGDLVTIGYDDILLDGSVERREISFHWFDVTGANIVLNSEEYFTSADTASITLYDPDWDTDGLANTDQVTIWAFSTVDSRGERVGLTESGIGIFTGSVGFETSNGANNGRVFVQDGVRVWVDHFDHDVLNDGPAAAADPPEDRAKSDTATWHANLPVTNLPPSAGLVASPSTQTRGVPVDFTITSSDVPPGSVVARTLEFGDGSTDHTDAGTPSPATVSHTYLINGTYAVNLTVTDNDGATRTVSVTVTIADPPAPPTTTTTTGTATTTTTTGTATTTTTTTTAPVSQAELIKAFSQGITMTFSRDGSIVTICWTLPTTVPPGLTVAGVQIWKREAESDPWSFIVTLSASSTDFGRSCYDYDGNTIYQVTAYFGQTTALGFFNPALNQAPTTSDFGGSTGPSPTDSDDGLPAWAWVLLAIGILVLIALLVGIIVAASRGPGEGDDEGWDDIDEVPGVGHEPAAAAAMYGGSVVQQEPEPEPAPTGPVETYHLECPECQTRFSATGSKPLTTHCPGCGKRGMLR